MFEKGLVHIVASDGHDRECRPPVLDQVRRRLIHRYGEKAALAVLDANPRAVVDNALLPEPWICPERQSQPWKFLRGFARSAAGCRRSGGLCPTRLPSTSILAWRVTIDGSQPRSPFYYLGRIYLPYQTIGSYILNVYKSRVMNPTKVTNENDCT